jgi:hypothetical protein
MFMASSVVDDVAIAALYDLQLVSPSSDSSTFSNSIDLFCEYEKMRLRLAGVGVENCGSIGVLRWNLLGYLRSPRWLSWAWNRGS